MIYKTYFDVPDGAKCRPYARGNGSFYQFADKSSWRENAVQICTNVTLDKWETEEKKIEISREDLFDALLANSHGKDDVLIKVDYKSLLDSLWRGII